MFFREYLEIGISRHLKVRGGYSHTTILIWIYRLFFLVLLHIIYTESLDKKILFGGGRV